ALSVVIPRKRSRGGDPLCCDSSPPGECSVYRGQRGGPGLGCYARASVDAEIMGIRIGRLSGGSAFGTMVTAADCGGLPTVAGIRVGSQTNAGCGAVRGLSEPACAR